VNSSLCLCVYKSARYLNIDGSSWILRGQLIQALTIVSLTIYGLSASYNLDEGLTVRPAYSSMHPSTLLFTVLPLVAITAAGSGPDKIYGVNLGSW
jgi:hypothetical protein